VELHRVSAALDLGDITQVIESVPRINTAHLPVERQVTHLIDLARALNLVAKDDDALHTLLTAERTSPGIVRHSVAVREVVRSMYRRAPASAGKKSSPLLALAERCRAVGTVTSWSGSSAQANRVACRVSSRHNPASPAVSPVDAGIRTVTLNMSCPFWQGSLVIRPRCSPSTSITTGSSAASPR
jgi:hypothetical protein